MDFVSVEAPPTRVTAPGETIELLDASLGVVAANVTLEVVADELIQARAKSLGSFTRSYEEVLVHGESHIRSLCVHGHCGKAAGKASRSRQADRRKAR